MECDKLPPDIHQLSILITDDTEIRALNSFYRKQRKATDVLSFSQVEGKKKGMSSLALGDVVISADRAVSQARRYRVTLAKEMLRLIIHGILHLFGHDHVNVTRRKAQEMRKLEKVLLARYSKGFLLQ